MIHHNRLNSCRDSIALFTNTMSIVITSSQVDRISLHKEFTLLTISTVTGPLIRTIPILHRKKWFSTIWVWKSYRMLGKVR